MRENNKKKQIIVGLLAHVDAGKTTLAENILYTAKAIGKMGRVDHRDTFLDTHSLEKSRGITIFSKQARLVLKDWQLTLIDTPGHVDFGGEMERALQILDYAILVINGNEGVQSHTKTLWNLLSVYEIPVFLFVNKMDRPENQQVRLMEELKARLSQDCLAFSGADPQAFYEELALKDEEMLEGYLEGRLPTEDKIACLIEDRKVFPVYFGSALKDFGVDQLLEGMALYMREKEYGESFAARVYKIDRDGNGNRLTHIKVTGGSLKVKQLLTGCGRKGEEWQEKVDQIRLYSGENHTMTQEAEAGMVCALTGLSQTYVGEALGAEEEAVGVCLEPVLSYGLVLDEGVNAFQAYGKLESLCQEDPLLELEWQEESGRISVKVMGEVQLEILQSLILERFQMKVGFDPGHIVYKETIAAPVEGVGHFEPLRHYAEAHILLEPLEAGSGLQFDTVCSEDVLDRNWQRLILTHLRERQHPGVLTGSPITDIRLTLLTGKAHPKHTEGGDFRQATYRAVRQGLRKTESILLEPVYEFSLELGPAQVGRAMSDIQRMKGTAVITESSPEDGGTVVLTGTCPVVTMRNYHREVLSYTGGEGRLSCRLKGYEPCHNSEEVIEELAYVPEKDTANPTGSIFCSHGAGVYVEWDRVEEQMHLPAAYRAAGAEASEAIARPIPAAKSRGSEFIGQEEIERILSRTFHANSKGKREEEGRLRRGWQPRREPIQDSGSPPASGGKTIREAVVREPYLLVDGYNIIFAWKELKELAAVNLDGARGRLMDLMCNYQAMKGCRIILVFDAYRVEGHREEAAAYQNIHVVYTRQAQTADQYIEKFTHLHKKEYSITVATSDGLEQVIIRGQGAALLSAGDLKEEMERTAEEFRERHMAGETKLGHSLGDYFD